MPGLLMDTTLGDLFEDGESTMRGVHELVDQLRQGGCRQKIAWGKLGCIASISPDGTDIDIRHLMSSRKDGAWGLSAPYTIKDVLNGAQLASVYWNSLGSEFAVVDIYGRLSMFTVYVSIDRVNRLRQSGVTVKDDMSMLAGFWWLNHSKSYALSKPAQKGEDGIYRYPTNSHFPSVGPVNPIASKSACLGVTKSGIVKLWYAADPIPHILKASAELETYTSMDDIITHATFQADKDNTAVLAVYTQSKQLRIYRIAINWNVPPVPTGQVLMQIPSTVQLIIKRLKVEHCPVPESVGVDGSHTFLTHLEILPLLPSSPIVSPTILGFFATAGHRYTTTIKRWELKTTSSSLHSSFDQLAQRRNSTSVEKERYELVPLTDVLLHKCALSITQLNASTIIAIAYSDGTIDIRDRINLNAVQTAKNHDRVNNMVHAGWQFPLLGSYMDIALSPNHTAAALFNREGDISLVLMGHQDSLEGTVEDNPNMLVAAVALAQQHACSCNNHSNNDDLAIIARQYPNKDFITCLLIEANRSLGQNTDFLSEQSNEKLLRNPFFQRCLSLQFTLYFKGWAVSRPIPAKIASAGLHLKMTSVAFGYFMNNVVTRNRNDPDDVKANALQNLLGVVKWEINFHIYLVDELLELARKVRSNPSDINLVKKTILETNSCALPLILTGALRWLLKYNSRALRGFDQSARDNLASSTLDDTLRQGFQSLRTIMDANPVKINMFEKLLVDIINNTKSITADWTEAQRTEIDRHIVLTGDIPAVFAPIVEYFLTKSLSLLKNDIDPSSIFFFDTTWLGLHDDKKSLEYRDKCKTDALRKVPLKAGTLMRRCLRCCETVEDLVPSPRMGVWLQSTSRVCVCGSLWMHDA